MTFSKAEIVPGKYTLRSVPLKQLFAADFFHPGLIANVPPAVEMTLSTGGNVNFHHEWIFDSIPGSDAFHIRNRHTGQWLNSSFDGQLLLFGASDADLDKLPKSPLISDIHAYARWAVDLVPEAMKPDTGPFSATEYVQNPWVAIRNLGTGKYLTVGVAGGGVYLACLASAPNPKQNVLDVNAMFRLRRAGKVHFRFHLDEQPTAGQIIEAHPFKLDNTSSQPHEQSAGTLSISQEVETETNWSISTGIEFSFTETVEVTAGKEGIASSKGSVSGTQTFKLDMTTGGRTLSRNRREFSWEPKVTVDAHSSLSGTAMVLGADGDLAFTVTFEDEDGKWTEKGTISAKGLAYFLRVDLEQQRPI